MLIKDIEKKIKEDAKIKQQYKEHNEESKQKKILY